MPVVALHSALRIEHFLLKSSLGTQITAKGQCTNTAICFARGYGDDRIGQRQVGAIISRLVELTPFGTLVAAHVSEQGVDLGPTFLGDCLPPRLANPMRSANGEQFLVGKCGVFNEPILVHHEHHVRGGGD